MSDLDNKCETLKNVILSLESVAVAFSGGVDSTFLLSFAHTILGDKAIAVTAHSASYPQRELDEASAFTKLHNIKHIVVASEELDIEGFSDNPVNRCYLCKKELFAKIIKIAKENGIKNIAEGSNMDDNGDYRPGLIAIDELHIKSPLREAGLTKEDIRILSREMGLPTWNKQSFACLASRFPYGEKITLEKLNMIDKAEQYLLNLGYKQVRVRHHGDIARIEIDENGFDSFLDKNLRDNIHKEFKKLGFTYIALDIKGYRTGSMNEKLGLSGKK